MKIFYKTLNFFLISFLFPLFVYAEDISLTLNAKNVLKLSKPHDCNSLVDLIIDDSRRYLAIDGYSIEQIEKRSIVYETDTTIECNGIAILNNTSKSIISYKTYKDSQNDWMMTYSLNN